VEARARYKYGDQWLITWRYGGLANNAGNYILERQKCGAHADSFNDKLAIVFLLHSKWLPDFLAVI